MSKRSKYVSRTLDIYDRMRSGELVSIHKDTDRYGCDARTIRNAITNIEDYLIEKRDKGQPMGTVVYKEGYVIE